MGDGDGVVDVEVVLASDCACATLVSAPNALRLPPAVRVKGGSMKPEIPGVQPVHASSRLNSFVGTESTGEQGL